MSSPMVTIFGTAVLAVLLAGYLAQHYLPPPKPKIVGIDLGTTYSCIGVYQAASGEPHVLPDAENHNCIPSVVAFNEDNVVVGYKAVALSDHNPEGTLYDAKRFIGKHFSRQELEGESTRYPFKLVADETGMMRYVVQQPSRESPQMMTPEQISAHVLATLKATAEANLDRPVKFAVMSVPAEFNAEQRNYTRRAAELAGLEILRLINEPTAAAMAYGLHKRSDVRYVVVVDLGGGTLDVSLLLVQGGMFLTQAMAGNNHLGGQDFNQRIFSMCTVQIENDIGQPLSDPEDLQALRLAVEEAKLSLTQNLTADIHLDLRSFHPRLTRYKIKITREQFEEVNADLFKKVLEPIVLVLEDVELERTDIDEIVLVGGSTRIPRIRQMVAEFVGKQPNVATDPELAVVSGVAIQAGIMGGSWPLKVSAIEVPTTAKKIHVH